MSNEEWFNTDGLNVTVVKDPNVEVSDEELRRAFAGNAELNVLTDWVKSITPAQAAMDPDRRNGAPRSGGLFERDRYVTPVGIFSQFKVAKDAAMNDDVVSNVLESTEALVFNKVRVECGNDDEENIWSQILDDMELDIRLREMWRDLFVFSQYYVSSYWEKRTYKVDGRRSHRPARKAYEVNAPTSLSLLDPMKVMPVGDFLFGRDKLAFIANAGTEAESIENVIAGRNTTDLVIREMITGPYSPTPTEEGYLNDLTGGRGVGRNTLFELNSKRVWRHTATRPTYERFAPVRLSSIFELLDLKHQLRQMDRAHLLGAPLRVDQRVATPDGWVPIGAIRPGDRVMGPDGKPGNVLGVFPQGVLPMFRVEFSDGTSVYCDESHRWNVETRSGRARTLTLKEIVSEGLWEPNGPGKRLARHRIPVTSPLELPAADLPLDPYLIGYMLGDGSFSQSVPKIASAEPLDEQPWRDALPPGALVSEYEKRAGFCQQYGLRGDGWRCNPVTEGLRDIGLWGLSCSDKHIPDAYLWGSVDQRWALLQGLMDSDGSAHAGGGAEFSNTSRKLIDGVALLVQSLGGVATVYEVPASTKRGGDRVTCYRLYARFAGPEAPFRISRKAASWKPRTNDLFRSIVGVTRSVDADAVCIATDCKDNLFLTEGMIATHNTNFIVLVRKGSDAQPATSGELANLSTSVRTVARTPLIVGDHRLSVDIVTPTMDTTLDPKRYNNIDSRITARLYQIFHLGGFCLTPDVEVMTDSGWKTYDQIVPGDMAYSVDPETNLGTWAEIEAVNVFDFDGPMHRIETQRLDVLSTPNHRWYTHYDPSMKDPDRHRFVESKDLTLTDRIPLRFDPADLPAAPSYKDELVRLVAWYMTEGTRRYEYNGKRCAIAQSATANPENVAEISRDLRSLFGEPGRSGQGDWWFTGNEFYIASSVGASIVDLCPGRVKVPSYEFVNSLTYDQLRDFLDVCIKGDGHVEPNGRRTFYSKDQEIIDVFEYVAVRLGFSVTHTVDKSYVVKREGQEDRSETVWRVNLGFNSHTNPLRAAEQASRNKGPARVGTEHYSGKVWCPTTSTGTWLARRNGKVFYTGNSAGASGDDSLKLARVIARGLESRRTAIARNFEKHILLPVWRENPSLTQRPKLMFTPRQVALDFDPNFMNLMRDLFLHGDISRETILGVLDIEQSDEARRREIELDEYDSLFPIRETSKGDKGRIGGGNRNGGGANPDSFVGNPVERRPDSDIPEDERRERPE
jgi:hypothetical protein